MQLRDVISDKNNRCPRCRRIIQRIEWTYCIVPNGDGTHNKFGICRTCYNEVDSLRRANTMIRSNDITDYLLDIFNSEEPRQNTIDITHARWDLFTNYPVLVELDYQNHVKHIYYNCCTHSWKYNPKTGFVMLGYNGKPIGYG